MAGDWIKIEHATIDKPEIYQMSEILNIDPHHVLGSVISVWVWMDKQLESCNANLVTKKLLDRKADVTGFADAMLQVGWLSDCDSGFEVPNFERHLGNSAKKRAETARRVTKHRQKSNTKSVTDSVTSALTREEKRREEKKEVTKVTKKKFTVPSIEEITDYCLFRKNIINPQQFIDHYESNGWMVGKNKMKDWKAAIRKWEANSKQQSFNLQPIVDTEDRSNHY